MSTKRPSAPGYASRSRLAPCRVAGASFRLNVQSTRGESVASQRADVQPDIAQHEDVISEEDDKLTDLIAEQEEIFLRRQPESARMAARARGSLAGGVPASWQVAAPEASW